MNMGVQNSRSLPSVVEIIRKNANGRGIFACAFFGDAFFVFYGVGWTGHEGDGRHNPKRKTD